MESLWFNLQFHVVKLLLDNVVIYPFTGEGLLLHSCKNPYENRSLGRRRRKLKTPTN